ncbi:MAG: bifunctional riboflavin kinase/FAD synthetase [Polyangiales bacterium]
MTHALFHDARNAPPAPRGRVIVIGNFDGVHRGHQQVLAKAAPKHGEELAVLTFEPHPAAVLGASAPPRLTRLARKVELLERHGVDTVIAQRFDARFAALSPEAFVDEVLVRALSARVVVVGWDFRFGARRAGDVEKLRALGKEGGFTVEVQEMVADAKGPLSSTRVRDALAAGDLDDARAVLGRPHAIEGVVVSGDKRGRTLGFPTANVAEVEEALPAYGVYAVVVDAASSNTRAGAGSSTELSALARGVANVGLRPTVQGGGGHPSIEVHLFDLPEEQRDLYGDTLRVHFVARLREERRFPGLDALRAQIAEDAANARRIGDAIDKPASGCWY